ncbi:MAG: hypothetical protein ACP5O1_10335 [Phycisphaerae bacterium]
MGASQDDPGAKTGGMLAGRIIFFLPPWRFDFLAAGIMLDTVEREVMNYTSYSLLLLLTRVISAGS